MKLRVVVLAAAVAAAALLVPRSAWAFGVNDVLKMHEKQVPDSIIVAHIAHGGQVIRVSSQDFRRLKQAGVSDAVIGALVQSDRPLAAKDNHGWSAHGWAYAPYAPYAYPYAYPYAFGPRFSVGFTFGYPAYPWPYRRFYPYPYRFHRF